MRFSLSLLVLFTLLAGCTAVSSPDGPNDIVDPDAGTPAPDSGTPTATKPADSTFTLSLNQKRDGYTYQHYVFRHPEVHGKSTKLSVTQHVNVIIPDGVDASVAPVYFLFDNEEAATLEDLMKKTALPRFFRSKMIYVGAEHRGYGQSLSDDVDQSVPKYVTPENAIDDAHSVITALKKQWKGPYIVVGYSYGGGLVVQFGATYPNDAKVIVSSSGVMKFPAGADFYEAYTRHAYGEEGYAKLTALLRSFQPAKNFDATWQDREMLEGGVVGLTQYAWAQPLLPAVNELLGKPKDEVLAAVRAIDKTAAQNQASNYGYSRSLSHVTRKDMLARDLGMRVYFYQQCSRLGIFHISPTNDGAFVRTLADRQAECEQMFGKANVIKLRANEYLWTPGDYLEAFGEGGPKLVYLQGGKDPWQEIGIPTPNWEARSSDATANVYDTFYGSYIEVPGGFHAPDFGESAPSIILWGEINRLLGTPIPTITN